MDKLRFMYELGRLQIPIINLDDDQIADELRDDECIEDLLFYQNCKAAKEEGFLSDQEAQEFVANLPQCKDDSTSSLKP